jgi:energy-coupling factor transport system substrate-specific component
MSWQLVTFAGLGLVLLCGFAWYERSRPPARLVALVAALAALAVAGRLVLAPLPNLVATTDIALLTGYALGGPAGFAVGALAAPITNIWLGQGPWTPWQMAGWGLVGLAGAALAAASGRRLGRLGLACAAALAGLAYGALLDLHVMVSFGGEQSVDRYLALSARGLPFNLAHAAGNFAIALAAGPALVRMISRYRTRLEFSWPPAAAQPLAVLALALILSPLAASGTASGAATGEARAWLERAQNPDGGYGAALEYPSSPAMTGWAMLGLEAAGRNPLDLRGGEGPVGYLRSEVGRLRSVGDLERTILALEGAGVDPRRFAGHDLVAELRARRDRDGSVDNQTNLTAFYVLAMRAAGTASSELSRSAGWLRDAQAANGGWGFHPGAPSEADSTGAALQALAAAGADGPAAAEGARFLRRSQDRSGGWALARTGAVNAQSTAWAVQGLVATGTGGEPLQRALAYLATLRAPDGHYRYSRSSDQTPVWVTAQVLLAVRRQALPLAPVPRQPIDREASGGKGSDPEPAITPGAGGRGAAAAGPAAGAESSGAGRARGRRSAGRRKVALGAARADSRSRQAPAAQPGRTIAGEPPRSAGAVAEDDGSHTLAYALGGLGALALALAAGFLWYRRRLS